MAENSRCEEATDRVIGQMETPDAKDLDEMDKLLSPGLCPLCFEYQVARWDHLMREHRRTFEEARSLILE